MLLYQRQKQVRLKTGRLFNQRKMFVFLLPMYILKQLVTKRTAPAQTVKSKTLFDGPFYTSPDFRAVVSLTVWYVGSCHLPSLSGCSEKVFVFRFLRWLLVEVLSGATVSFFFETDRVINLTINCANSLIVTRLTPSHRPRSPPMSPENKMVRFLVSNLPNKLILPNLTHLKMCGLTIE